MTAPNEGCRCGRRRASEIDLRTFRGAIPFDHPYAMAPSTWQLVRLGVCLPPDASHLDIPATMLAVCWSLGECRLPSVGPEARPA